MIANTHINFKEFNLDNPELLQMRREDFIYHRELINAQK
jgi:hypothetical protein